MSFDTTHQNTGLSEGQGYALHPKEKRASQPSFLLRITSSTSSSLAFIKALAFSEVASFTSYSPTRECRFALRQPVNHSFFSGSNPQCAYFAKSLAMYGTLKYIRSSSGNGGRGLSIFFFQYLALYCSYLMLYIKGALPPLTPCFVFRLPSRSLWVVVAQRERSFTPAQQTSFRNLYKPIFGFLQGFSRFL